MADDVRVDAARHLILIARNLRAAGDIELKRLSEDGVSDVAITLAGELELIALQLDWDGCIANANAYGGPDGDPQLDTPA